MDNADNRRVFSRVMFDSYAKVTTESREWAARVIDLSLKGILLEDLPGHEARDVDTISIQLSTDAVICMDVEWIHSRDGNSGFICKNIDIDSITHLRRLVELNMGDTQLLERELSMLGTGSAEGEA